MIDALLSRAPIDEPCAVLVAHPDDETLGVGSVLRRLRHLTLIHLTDGAPHEMHDAQRAGFGTREQYSAARRHELDSAMQALQARPMPVPPQLLTQRVFSSVNGWPRTQRSCW